MQQNRHCISQQYQRNHQNDLHPLLRKFCLFHQISGQFSHESTTQTPDQNLFCQKQGDIYRTSRQDLQHDHCQHIGKWIVTSAFHLQNGCCSVFQAQISGTKNGKDRRCICGTDHRTQKQAGFQR